MYFADLDQIPDDKRFLLEHVESLLGPSSNDLNIAVTKGYNMALGVLSGAVLREMGSKVVEVLCDNCIAKGRESDDAETRR